MGEAFYKSALLGEAGGREGAARAVKAKKNPDIEQGERQKREGELTERQTARGRFFFLKQEEFLLVHRSSRRYFRIKRAGDFDERSRRRRCSEKRKIYVEGERGKEGREMLLDFGTSVIKSLLFSLPGPSKYIILFSSFSSGQEKRSREISQGGGENHVRKRRLLPKLK